MKRFNTTAVCIPSRHYMADLSERVAEIQKMVDAGAYFTINRARQYGKTTTLTALRNALQKSYIVISIDFQGLEDTSFKTEESFCNGFIKLILEENEYGPAEIPAGIRSAMEGFTAADHLDNKLNDLLILFRLWCKASEKAIVLMIDEADRAANNQVFLGFLAGLREGYINRDTKGMPAFQSVILAGVTDVRHLKSRIRDDERHEVNSPWNIASDFDIDMSLSETGIQGMLREYESDHHTGMDTGAIARQIREYTNGYPYLVSRICQLMDEKVTGTFKNPSEVWTRRGMDEAVRMLLEEDNTLFRSVTGKLSNYPELKASIRSILMEGTRLAYNAQQESIRQLQMYGLIRNDHNTVRIANRIFETMLYNLFLSDEELKANVFSREGGLAKSLFVQDGKLNMRLILEKFIETYAQVMGPLRERFREKDGREQFLLYLKPIINGTGNYYIEAQTRDQTRTDVIVDYPGQQYIIELEIWRGERYHSEGERQISEYLDYWNLTTGYMLSFNFNKKKEQGVKQVHIGDKLLYEGTL